MRNPLDRLDNDGLPEPVYAAMLADPYEAGECDRSLTELIGPARIAALARRFGRRQKASETFYALFGQAVHVILERSGQFVPQALTEHRWFGTIDGWVISGQCDYFDRQSGTLWDWKVAGTYTTHDGPKMEHQAQMNGLRYLAHLNGIGSDEIRCLNLGMIYRDWSASQRDRASETTHYPKVQAEILTVDIWTLDQTAAYLRNRVRLHKEAQQALDLGDPIPVCTDEERWKRVNKSGTKYARCESFCPVRWTCEYGTKGSA